jgi:hypothetical protein
MFNDDFYLRSTFLYGHTHQMDVPLAAGFCNLYGNDRENYQYIATHHLRHLRQANQLLSLVNNTLHVIIYGKQKSVC